MIDETTAGSKVSKVSKATRAAKEKIVAKAKKTAKPSKAKAPAKAAKGGEKAQSSGVYIRELIAKDMDTDEILRLNKKKFPDSKAKACDVSWNRGYAERLKAAKKSKK